MNYERQETIEDIVAEMRRDCPARHLTGARYCDGDWVYTKGTVLSLADRIEKADTRLSLLIQEKFTQIAQQAGEIDELKRENARLKQRLVQCEKVNEQQKKDNIRLRAALKPVLKCKVMSAMTAETGPGRSEYCATILEKAQRIYNGEGESEVKE